MRGERGVKISIIYAISLSSITLFLSVANLSKWVLGAVPGFLVILSLASLAPLAVQDVRKSIHFVLFTVVSFLFALGVIMACLLFIEIPGDPMDSFILFLISALLLTSLRDSLKLLYSGLSFYLVGVFLLLAFAGIKITILLADILDYYVNCIGESCSPYPFAVIPSLILFLLALPATYPYIHREIFRREEHDKEGP